MKKILLSAILVSMSTGLFAQFSKGALAITGVFGLNGGNNKTDQTNIPTATTVTTFDQKTSGFRVVPAISYFVTDNLEGGIMFAITKNTTINNYPPQPQPQIYTKTIKNEQPLSGFGLFGNYYFKPGQRYNFYAGIQFGVGSGKGKVTTTRSDGNATVVETNNNASTVGLNMGFLYFLKPSIALNANLGLLSFNTIKSESTNNNTITKTNNSNWALGVNGVVINIGVKIFLRNDAVLVP